MSLKRSMSSSDDGGCVCKCVFEKVKNQGRSHWYGWSGFNRTTIFWLSRPQAFCIAKRSGNETNSHARVWEIVFSESAWRAPSSQELCIPQEKFWKILLAMYVGCKNAVLQAHYPHRSSVSRGRGVSLPHPPQKFSCGATQLRIAPSAHYNLNRTSSNLMATVLSTCSVGPQLLVDFYYRPLPHWLSTTAWTSDYGKYTKSVVASRVALIAQPYRPPQKRLLSCFRCSTALPGNLQADFAGHFA